MPDINGGMTDYEKERIRAAAEITKGILSNPNINIEMNGNALVVCLKDGSDVQHRNIAKIFSEAIIGVKNGWE